MSSAVQTPKRGRGGGGGEDTGGTRKRGKASKAKTVHLSFQQDIVPRILDGTYTFVFDGALQCYGDYTVQATDSLPEFGFEGTSISIEGTFMVLRKVIEDNFLDYVQKMPESLLEMVDSVTADDWGCKREDEDFPNKVVVTAAPISNLFHMMAAFLINVDHITDTAAREKTKAQAEEFFTITRLFVTTDARGAFQCILDAEGSKLNIIVNFDTSLQAYIDTTDDAVASNMEKELRFIVVISRSYGSRFNDAKRHRATIKQILDLTRKKASLSDIARLTAIEDPEAFIKKSNRKEEWMEIRAGMVKEFEEKSTPTGAAPAHADKGKITPTLPKIIQAASIQELKPITSLWVQFFDVKHTSLDEIQISLKPLEGIINRLRNAADSIVGIPWEKLESPLIKNRIDIITKELWELIPGGEEKYPADKILQVILSIAKQILKGVNARCEMYIRTGKTYLEKENIDVFPHHELFKHVVTIMGQENCGDMLRNVYLKTQNQPRPTMFRVRFSLDAFKQEEILNCETGGVVTKDTVHKAGSFYFKNFSTAARSTFATIGFWFKWIPLDDMNLVTPYIDQAIEAILKYKNLAPIAHHMAWDLLFLYAHYAGNDQAKNAEAFNRHTGKRGGTKTTVRVEEIQTIEVTEEEVKEKNLRTVMAAIAGSDEMKLVDADKMAEFAADPIFTVERVADGTEVLNIDQVAKEPARPTPPPEVSAESGAAAMDTEAGAGGGHGVDESRLLDNPLDAKNQKCFQEPLIQKVFEQLVISKDKDTPLEKAVLYQTRRFVNEHLTRLDVKAVHKKGVDDKMAYIVKQTQVHVNFGEMTDHLIQAKSSFQKNLYPTAIILVIIQGVYEHLNQPVPDHVSFAAIERDVQALAAAAEIPADTVEPAPKATRSAASTDGSGGAAAGPP